LTAGDAEYAVLNDSFRLLNFGHNILTELLQRAANFHEVIGIGFVFDLLTLRQCLTSQGKRKERNGCDDRFGFLALIPGDVLNSRARQSSGPLSSRGVLGDS
jgi:hypothetical protein